MEISTKTFPIVDWLKVDAIYTLTDAITAFGTCEDWRHATISGPICELRKGAHLIVCGCGFNHRTVKVKYGGCNYYVYWRDLATAESVSTLSEDVEADLSRLGELLADYGQPANDQGAGHPTVILPAE